MPFRAECFHLKLWKLIIFARKKNLSPTPVISEPADVVLAWLPTQTQQRRNHLDEKQSSGPGLLCAHSEQEGPH